MPILLTRPSGGAYVLGTRRWQHFSTVRGLTSSADVAPLALWRTRPHTPDEGRSSRVSMRAARATRTPRRASRRPVVRAPRARAALLTGNTSSSPTRRDELGGWEHAANGDEAVLGASDGVAVGAAVGGLGAFNALSAQSARDAVSRQRRSRAMVRRLPTRLRTERG